MAVKSSRAHFFYAKAVVVFALVAGIAASRATAESRPEDDKRSSQALSATHTPVLIKRMLRSQTVMTVTEPTSASLGFLKAMNMDELSPKVKETVQEFLQRLWQLTGRTPKYSKISATKTNQIETLDATAKVSDTKRASTETIDATAKVSGTIRPKTSKSNAIAIRNFFRQLFYVKPLEIGLAIISKVLNAVVNDALLAYKIYTRSAMDETNMLLHDMRDLQFKTWWDRNKTPKEMKSKLDAAVKSENDRVIFDRIASQYERFYDKRIEKESVAGTSQIRTPGGK